MLHIVFIVPYEEARQDVNRIFQDEFCHKELIYDVIVAKNEDIPNLKIPQADIFIARGFSAITLKDLGLCCVQINTTGYDVVVAVKECVQRFGSQKIAIVGSASMVGGTEMIHKIFPQVEFSSHSFSRKRDMLRFLQSMDKNGSQAIVSGLSGRKWADTAQFPCVMLHIGKEAIRQSIEEAIRTVEATRLESAKASRLQTILDCSFEGILSVNKNERITLCNKVASATFCRSGEMPTGRLVTDFIPTLDLTSVFQEQKQLVSQVHNLAGQMISVNCIPLTNAHNTVGAVITFQNANSIREAEGQIRRKLHKKGFVAKKRFCDIIYRDNKMRDTIETAKWYATSDSNVLLIGETGTGKEIFTQSIHNESSRRTGPFVALNCAALPEQLLESELFGYVEGAFTGAAKGGKIGLFEIAHGGTLFLDEIGDISPRLQSGLLRVIQEREIIRLGDDRVIPINVRIISATNRDLEQMVLDGCFRQDLLYRLEVLKLKLPPLRERKEDILLLTHYYISKERERTNCKLRDIAPEAHMILENFPWQGNVRQLCNFCERICVVCQDEYAGESTVRKALDVELLPTLLEMSEQTAVSLKRPLEKKADMERERVRNALEVCGGSRKQAASLLCIDTSTLWRRMKRYGLFEESTP